MKITFTLEQVLKFYALSPDDQRKVLRVAHNLKNTSDDKIEKSAIDTSAPLLAQELIESAIRRIENRRKRRQAREQKQKTANREQPTEKKSAKTSKCIKEISIQASMSPKTARHMLWIKTNFNKFIGRILEGFATVKLHPEGARLFDQWSTVLSKLRKDLESLWVAAPSMLYTSANRYSPRTFSYRTIVA